MILCCKTGIGKVAINMPPFAQASIIEHLQLVGNDEGNNTCAQTLLEHNKTPNAPITILEWVYLFETNMEVENILKRTLLLGIVILYQSPDTIMHLFGFARILTTNFVWKSFIVANGKPVFATIGCACFQDAM